MPDVGGQDIVREEARETPVSGRVDVVVCGGGLGGVSAAMAAARAGANTLLVERNGYLGGVATAGMCCSVFNSFYTADHRLGVTGNAVDIVDALAAATGFGRRWHAHRGHIIYDLERAKVVLAERLEGAGAEFLLGTVVADVVRAGSRLRGVILENKRGRSAVLADTVVDATGDADVAALAGVPLHTRAPAGHSLCFRLASVDVDRFVQYFVDHPDQYPEYMDVDWTFDDVLQQYRDTGTFLFPHGGPMQMALFREAVLNGEYPQRVGMHDTLDACQIHALRELGIAHIITGFAHFNDLDPAKITQAMGDGRRMAFEVAAFFRRRVPGFESAVLAGTADNLGIRASRWLDGEFVFTKAMRTSPWRAEDRVGRGVVQVDLVKHRGERAWGVQTFTTETFDIPLRCLLPRHVEGLIMGAGRSVSAESPMLLRAMVLTMAVGQGAGVAAAWAARSGGSLRRPDLAAVQDMLRRQGVALGP